MDNDKWTTQYEQMNMRSRWYGSQLWYVPFAYVAILGYGLQKMPALSGWQSNLLNFGLAIFSFGVFVHVVSLKYGERRAVRRMQQLEEESVKSQKSAPDIKSRGASPLYMTAVTYMEVLMILGAYFFLWRVQDTCARFVGMTVLTILSSLVLYKDYIRSKKVKEEIRDALKSST